MNNQNKKILLIESEPQVQKIFSHFLLICGYSVVTASDGMEGLEKVKSDNSIMLVVITELNIPFINGRELLQEIRKIKPLLNSIVLPGKTEHENDLEEVPANKIIKESIGLIDFSRIVSQYI